MDQTNLDIYGHPPIPWSRAERQLEAAEGKTDAHYSLRRPARRTAARRGCRRAVGRRQALFVSGPGTRKSRNLAERGDCVISVALPDLDLVVEGEATKVTDGPTLQRLAERYDAQGWPVTFKDGAFTAPYSAPSAGPPPWDLYEFTPRRAFGVASAEPHGATRWDFGA